MSSNKEFTLVLGGPGCGKTTSLVQCANKLVEGGRSADELYIVVPSEQARQAMKNRCREVLCEPISARIVTIRQLCIDILASAEARLATGRTPNILNAVEELFLLEDLKTTGIKPRRLREMLQFFYRSFTELADEEKDFLQDADEVEVLNALSEQLLIRNAMLPAELSARALRYLRAEPLALGKWCKSAVFVDDYQGLNKASQLICAELASGSLYVTGNPQQHIKSCEPFAYLQGLTDFAQQHAGTVTSELHTAYHTPQLVSAIGNALVLDKRGEGNQDGFLAGLNEDRQQGHVEQVKWKTAQAELSGLALYVKNLVMGETAQIKPEEVFIAAPNKLWGRLLGAELEKRGVPVNTALNPRRLSGNPQRLESSVAMRAFTLLCLLANPDDAVAWRSWIGFGDHLTNSAAWVRLCAYGQELGLAPIAALAQIAKPENKELPFIQASLLAQAWNAGNELVVRLANKHGFGLVKGLEECFGTLPGEFYDLIEPLTGDEDAAALAARARSRLSDSCYPKGGVRLGTYETAYCLEARLVILTGLINGFMPTANTLDPVEDPDKRQRLFDEQLYLLHGALMRSSDVLVLSYFHKEEIEYAATLKLNVSRIRVDHGVRMAVLSPSVYLDHMGPALPGAVSFI